LTRNGIYFILFENKCLTQEKINMINLSYKFSSPGGDVIADNAILEQKFSLGPSERHPFMTLGDFFGCIGQFLLSEKGPVLTEALGQILKHPVKNGEIEGITIRYEKYGTLYQICSVDISTAGNMVRMCVNAAFSESAKQTLKDEFELLTLLGRKSETGFLPGVYKMDWVEVKKSPGAESFLMALLEWFDGYEEWHFQQHNGSTRAFLWDMRGGYRFLSEQQTAEIVSQASRILTLYYDFESTRRITPWHHGAGDFIVKVLESGEIDLKLITARGYEPIDPAEKQDRLELLCVFCIETITKMRIDKWEGMGESTWADRFVLEAALKGFFEALIEKEERGRLGGLSAANVLKRLRSFEVEELLSLVRREFVDNKTGDFMDYMVVARNLESHASEIYDALQSFRC
jgi:hypothetical protein